MRIYITALITLFIFMIAAAQLLPSVPYIEVNLPIRIIGGNQTAFAKENSPVILTCSVQNPEPIFSVTWIHERRVIFESSGAGYEIREFELRIPSYKHGRNLAENHNGEYRCSVNGILSSNMVTLTKPRIRQFRKTLKDSSVNIISGNTALIPCHPPSSVPSPAAVFEYNNTVTIDESNDRYLLMSDGSLQVFNAQPSDSGMYRCIASNTITNDKIQSPVTTSLTVRDALLNTGISITPSEVVEGQEWFVHEGDSITLTCIHYGVPKPNTSWYRYQDVINEDGNMKTVADNLQITNIRTEDAGTYNCISPSVDSENMLATVHLIRVIAQPTISPTPREVIVTQGDNYELICLISQPIYLGDDVDLEGNSFYRANFLWLFDEKEIESYDTDYLNSTLTLPNADVDQTGLYQCIATPKYSPANTQSTYFNVIVKETPSTTLPPTKPTERMNHLVPAAPEVIQTDMTAVEIKWSMDSNPDVLSFRILKKEGKVSSWQLAAFDIPHQARQYVISGLSTGSKYRFRVTVVYMDTVLDGDPSPRIRIDPDFVPVVIEVTTPTPTTAAPPVTKPLSLLIPPLTEVVKPLGSLFMTQCVPNHLTPIIWLKDGHEISSNHRITINDEMYTISLVDLEINDSGRYECRLGSSVSEIRASTQLIVKEPVTEEHAAARIPISRPVCLATSPRSVELTWTGLDVISFYKIQYKKVGSTHDNDDWMTVPGNIIGYSKKVNDLTPGAMYRFRLVGVDEDNQSRLSDRCKIRLPDISQEFPQITLESAVESSYTSNDIKIIWSISEQESITPNDTFIVQVRPAHASKTYSRQWYNYSVSADRYMKLDEKIYYLYDLPANNSYDIRVVFSRYGVVGTPSNVINEVTVGDINLVPVVPDDHVEVSSTILKDGVFGGDLMYIILGSVLGSVVLLLVICVAICGIKQSQQRRALAALQTQKFEDNKIIYNEHLKVQLEGVSYPNGNAHTSVNGSLAHRSINGSLNSPHGSQRIGLNINPMNELDHSYGNNSNSDKDNNCMPPEYGSRQSSDNNQVDYNLMNHYPHFNNRATPPRPAHQSHINIVDDNPYSCSPYSSLPHRNIPASNGRSVTPTQFSTFLPPTAQDFASPHINGQPKFPHPHSLRSNQYSGRVRSPASSVSESTQKRRRRRKRRDNRNGTSSNERSDVTNTDFSSGEGTGAEETTPFRTVLPPPPTLLTSYPEKSQLYDGASSDAE